jgi:serine/threonine protein kinase
MIAQRYRIDKEIRRGTFGVIYKGIYEKKNEYVAIKLDYSSHASLKHEVRVIQYLYMAGVKHIPNIYWFGIYNDKPCLIMTLYECSLYDYIRNSRLTLTDEHFLKIIWLLLDVIENIHKNWVLHRDIKPQNVMIKGGELFLIDFGLATFYINDNGKHNEYTHINTIIGTPYFASINIHEGHRYSRRDDLISLGYVLLYMMGLSWDIDSSTPENEEYSPVDLLYHINKRLEIVKGYIEPYLVKLSINYKDNTINIFRIYMDYVYKLHYDENPKYTPLRQLFVY